jgi:ribosomal-protein-alanine N-acetyltransferase
VSAQLQQEWQLHAMQTQHLPQVMEIELQCYPFPWSKGSFEDCLRVGYSAWVVLDARQRMLAYALMSMGAGEAHILNICVAPAQQRRGLAGFLLQHLLMIARAAGVRLMLLEVRVSNLAAQALYQRFGFRQLGQRKAYYPAEGGREDARVMGLDL